MRNLILLLILMVGFEPAWVPGTAVTAPGLLPNTYCPVSQDELAEEEFCVEYAGNRVHFCCPKCKPRFVATPEAYEIQAPPHEAHDHATGNLSSNTKTSHWLSLLGKLHPLIVHFPIALIFVAAFSELAYVLYRQESLRTYARFSLFLGWITAVPAARLGWINASASIRTGRDAELLTAHRWSAIALLLIAGLALYVAPRAMENDSHKRIGVYRFLLLAGVLLTAFVGHLGGSLVFGPNYFNW